MDSGELDQELETDQDQEPSQEQEEQDPGLVVDIPVAKVFRPLLKPKRYKGAKGGRGSAKSWFFADYLLTRCITHAPLRAVCVREIQRSLQQSVKQLLENRIQHHGIQSLFRVLNTHIETPGGGAILFQGMQNHTADTIKSLEACGVAWVEEAQALSQRSLDLLRPTIRSDGSEIWFSWNPNRATDPVEKFLCGEHPPDDAVVVTANYVDNPWFPDVLRKDMVWDRKFRPDKYAHIWLGKHEENSEARVFKNWSVDVVLPPPGTVFMYGADFGFAEDPACMIRCWLRDEHTLVIDGEAYEVGCEIDDLPALFDKVDEQRAREWTCIADSARPDTISYLKRHGYKKMVGAKKGQNSVKEGVKFLQSYNVVIHPRCTHTIDEFSLYQYKIDKLTDRVLPELKDEDNHCIDSVRYAIEDLRRKHKRGISVW